MRLLLDCDTVFDRLTRGPFPGDATNISPEDAAVESHLQVCHECRQLAEALRPAVKLLHEAYADEVPSHDPLPVYLSEASTRSVSLAPTVREGNAAARKQAFGEWSIGWQLVAASLLGVVIGGLTTSGWLSGPSFSGRGPTGRQLAWSPSDEPRPTAQGLTALAALKLQQVCLSSNLNTMDRLRCCTDCHSSQSTKQKGIDVARLQLACVACHER
jgi:hypothetical protein